MKLKLAIFLALFIVSLQLASAVVVNTVEVSEFTPGSEGTIRIELENILDRDVEDVSLKLQFIDTSFISVGSSQQSVDEIEEDEDEDFLFRVRASPSISPGNYEVPYVVEYRESGEDQIKTNSGTLGIRVTANPILTYTVSADNPVVGSQGTINLQIVNKGFFDARFVSVRLLPEDFVLLSESEVYIGEIDSDDFENAEFDVRFTKVSPQVTAIVEYINFDNERVIETVNMPVTVYSRERAQELGIIQQSQAGVYVPVIITLILLFVLWRLYRRRKKLKRKQRLGNE